MSTAGQAGLLVVCLAVWSCVRPAVLAACCQTSEHPARTKNVTKATRSTMAEALSLGSAGSMDGQRTAGGRGVKLFPTLPLVGPTVAPSERWSSHRGVGKGGGGGKPAFWPVAPVASVPRPAFAGRPGGTEHHADTMSAYLVDASTPRRGSERVRGDGAGEAVHRPQAGKSHYLPHQAGSRRPSEAAGGVGYSQLKAENAAGQSAGRGPRKSPRDHAASRR